jgi:hypothetical protein
VKDKVPSKGVWTILLIHKAIYLSRWVMRCPEIPIALAHAGIRGHTLALRGTSAACIVRNGG